METPKIVALVVFVAVLLVAVSVLSFRGSRRHRQKLRTAKTVYGRIQEMEDGQMIAYLRKIDPYVFEELILWAFRKKGFRVRRNKRYSGDGGIDGRVKINGQTFLIQDKRYTGHVSLAHVKAFDEVCRRRHRQGLFIHTGRTGEGSREVVWSSPRVSVISGSGLVELLREK